MFYCIYVYLFVDMVIKYLKKNSRFNCYKTKCYKNLSELVTDIVLADILCVVLSLWVATLKLYGNIIGFQCIEKVCC